MNFIRSFLYAAWFYSSLGFIGIPCMPFAYMSRKFAIGATRFWAGTQRFALRWVCGIKTEFRGLEHLPKGAAIIAMRHQATYDTIAPFLFIEDPAFILKRELLKAPVFGVYASKGRMIPIDRGGALKTMKDMLARAKVETEEGRKIVIFPEGTRQLPDAPADIKPGVIFMYNSLNVPVVPVALNTGLCWRSFWRTPGHIIFECLPPIEPGLNRDAFTARLKAALEPATQRLVAEGRAAQAKKGIVVKPSAPPAAPEPTTPSTGM